MKNLDDFDSYRKATPINYSTKDHFNFFIVLVTTSFQLFLVLILETLENFVGLFKFKKPKDISGQTALVTGGANGLGREIAFRLAQEGCNIVIADLNIKNANETASEIAAKLNVKTAAFKVDVSDYDALQQLKKDIESQFGSVDILVNNAGIIYASSFLDSKPKDMQRVIDINLTSHFLTVHTFLGKMIERKRGHIVAISSIFGKFTFPMTGVYSASKFGVRGFMSALFDELCAFDIEDSIKLTTVFPAFINTQKELADLLTHTKELAPRLTPEYVADEVVKGILFDKKDVTVPKEYSMLQLYK